jgi:peptidoglycan/LPS O-acetylase OafA/YrhL
MVPSAASRISTSEARYPILDALRFILAFIVVMSHFGAFPLLAGVDTSTKFGHELSNAWGLMWWGLPAVMGFFVISGFCIHLPFRDGQEMPLGRYYARRYIRILVPVGGFLLLESVLGSRVQWWGPSSVLWRSVLWSLVCEEIYYALYPLLRWLRNVLGWQRLLPFSMVLGAGIAATHWHAYDWVDYGPFPTALILLPVWLLGCKLAEDVSRIEPAESAATVWKWRLVVWIAAGACGALHFKGIVHGTQTMLWFGVLAYFWIREELAYGKHHKTWPLLAGAGAWSYSLYLIHGPAMQAFSKIPVPNLGYIINWFVMYVFIFSFAYLFYLIVERPSHRLARRFRISAHKASLPIATAGVSQSVTEST